MLSFFRRVVGNICKVFCFGPLNVQNFYYLILNFFQDFEILNCVTQNVPRKTAFHGWRNFICLKIRQSAA